MVRACADRAALLRSAEPTLSEFRIVDAFEAGQREGLRTHCDDLHIQQLRYVLLHDVQDVYQLCRSKSALQRLVSALFNSQVAYLGSLICYLARWQDAPSISKEADGEAHVEYRINIRYSSTHGWGV